jgi:GntR family transcriptional regulator, transcriptional repressor for pyruvate dehydrogenase complex
MGTIASLGGKMAAFDKQARSYPAALTPLEAGGRQAAITRRLHQAIVLGLLQDGSQLPSETQLAAQLSVSTVTLRGSLAELRRQGLVVTRRGRGGGNFVRLPKNAAEGAPTQHLAELSIDDLRDMRDHSAVVGGGIAKLAAERASSATIAQLQKATQAILNARNFAESARADLWFHMEVAAATRSAQLAKAELAIQTTIAPLLWIPGAETQTTERAAAEHGMIVSAIASGEGATARKAAETHIGDAINTLIELRMELLT